MPWKENLRSINLFFLFLLMATSAQAGVVPLKDNILFAFENCKTLSVDLQKGELNVSLAPAFDLHCRQTRENKLEFKCDTFEVISNKKLASETYQGGSDLGEAELKSIKGTKIKFLVGKTFASYESAVANKTCAGIFIFEQDALKQKVSSPKSD